MIFTGEWATTIVLVVLTVFNAVLGLRGESKAEASLAALAGTMKSIARVRRDGEAIEIEARAGGAGRHRADGGRQSSSLPMAACLWQPRWRSRKPP